MLYNRAVRLHKAILIFSSASSTSGWISRVLCACSFAVAKCCAVWKKSEYNNVKYTKPVKSSNMCNVLPDFCLIWTRRRRIVPFSCKLNWECLLWATVVFLSYIVSCPVCSAGEGFHFSFVAFQMFMTFKWISRLHLWALWQFSVSFFSRRSEGEDIIELDSVGQRLALYTRRKK